MADGKTWADLRLRVISGLVMALVGFIAIWLGGLWFAALVALLSGLMAWEIGAMLAPKNARSAVGLGLFAGVATFAIWLPESVTGGVTSVSGFGYHISGAAGAAVLAGFLVSKLRGWAMLAVLAAILAGGALISWRDNFGASWTLWVLGMVVVTDIAGYFGGRALGGPKLWPRVSPKKTWSGTLSGWATAAGVSVVVVLLGHASWGLVLGAVALSIASQAGDLAESSLKRGAGIKDSSSLIPGHGGVFDRCDGMVGVGTVLFVALILQGSAG